MAYNHQELRSKILGRIIMAYWLSKFRKPRVLGAFMALIGLFYIAFAVSVRNVFENMPSLFDWESMFSFSRAAVMNTEIGVQLALSIFVIAIMIWAADFVSKNKNVLSGARIHS